MNREEFLEWRVSAQAERIAELEAEIEVLKTINKALHAEVMQYVQVLAEREEG